MALPRFPLLADVLILPLLEISAANSSHLPFLLGIALGSEFDGIGPDVELTGCQDMPLLAEGFARAGFTASEVEMICEGNALRFLRESL